MRIVVLAGCLLALAGLALGASLMPASRMAPVSVSLGAPGAPLTIVQAPAAKAPAAKAAAPNSIARSADQQVAALAPVIPVPAPPPAAGPSAPQTPAPAPQVQPTPGSGHCHGDHHCPRPG
ncbi:MAG TPA: hypothetical protein VF160_06000 [Candidatus Dormibacteraeota bacterium]